MTDENFNPLLVTTEQVINLWNHRDLTIFGKTVIVNTLINSKYAHRLMALPTPDRSYFNMHRAKIIRYIWGDRPVRMRYERLVQSYENLGIKLTDLYCKAIALQAVWPVLWFNRDDIEMKWSTIPFQSKMAEFGNVI